MEDRLSMPKSLSSPPRPGVKMGCDGREPDFVASE